MQRKIKQQRNKFGSHIRKNEAKYYMKTEIVKNTEQLVELLGVMSSKPKPNTKNYARTQ